MKEQRDTLNVYHRVESGRIEKMNARTDQPKLCDIKLQKKKQYF